MATLYFAYGSNLNLRQMASRCPTAELLGRAVLPDYKLTFRGPLDIDRAPGQQVDGAVFDIQDADELALDRYEGFPYYYGKHEVEVMLPDTGEFVTAMVYVMNRQHKGAPHPPSKSYARTVAQGYLDCGLHDFTMFKQAYREAEGPARVAV